MLKRITQMNQEQGWSRLAILLLLLILTPVALAFLGDVDSDLDIDNTDAQQVIEAVIGIRTLNPQQQIDADVDSDGDVDIADAQLIQQFVAGTLAEFPQRLPQNSGPIAMTRDGTLVGVVNPDNNTVTLIDPATDTTVSEIAVGREPIGITFSRNGLKAYVTNARDATVSVIDTMTFTVINQIPVGVEPFGVMVNFRGDLAYVSNLASAAISVIDLATETVINTIPVAAKPQGIAINKDSDTLYVTHLNGGQVSVINAQTLAVSDIILTELPFDELNTTNPAGKANRMKGIAINPTSNEAWLPHILSNSGNFVEALFNTSIFPAVTLIDTSTHTELTADRMTLFSGLATVVSSPEAIAFSPDGALAYLISATSNDLTIINTATRQQVGLLRDVGDHPRGIVVSPEGNKAYVFSRLSPIVSVVDLTTETLQADITVSENTLPPNIDNGRRLFFTSALPEVAQDRFFSCESCHFDGRDDAQTWFFTNGPRQTLSMAGGTLNTGLMHHNADRINVQDFVATFTRLQNGTGVTPGQLDDLADFVNNNIRFLENPSLNVNGSMSADARAGRRVFKQAGCADCHTGPFLTDATGQTNISEPLLHNVGIFAEGTGSQDETDKTRDQSGIAGGTVRPTGFFESTFLLGVWATEPYLHDGRSLDLLATLTTDNPGDQHGVTSTLSVSELNQLVAYLKSLDITNSRVQISFPQDGARIVGLSKIAGNVLPDVSQVDIFINGVGPITTTINNGVFIVDILPAMLPALSDGETFDITAIAQTVTGESGRDDIEVEVNFSASSDTNNSTIMANPNLIAAGGVDTSTITMTPRDVLNNPAGTGLTIEAHTTSGSLGVVEDKGDGTYQVILTSDTVANTATITANEQGGSLFMNTATVQFAAGDVDANTSTATTNPFALEADGIATALVTVLPRDAFGNSLGSGQSVSLSVDTGSISSPATNQGDGSYTAIYTAPTATSMVTISIDVNGTALATTPQITLIPDATAPEEADLGAITFGTPDGGISQITGGPGSVEPFATIVVENITQAISVTVQAGADGSFSVQIALTSNDEISIRVDDIAGNQSGAVGTVPFPVDFFAVRGVVQAAVSGGGFAPVSGVAVELDVADLTNPLAPGFSPVFAGGQFLTAVTGADGSFEIILPDGFVPDPDLVIVTGPDTNNDGLVEAIDNFALVNDINRTVLVDSISTSIIFLIGFNDQLLGNAPPAFPVSHFSPAERTAIEDTMRAATTEKDFFGVDALQVIADDIFFDIDGPKDGLDTIALATFQTAAASPGNAPLPTIITGQLTVPGSGADIPLANELVDLATLSFFNGTSCNQPICVAPIAGSSAQTDANGHYSLQLPGFVIPGSTTIMVAIGDLTYDAGSIPGLFDPNIGIFSLGTFVTDSALPVNMDLAGAVAMSLIQIMNVPITNFSPAELDSLIALLRSKIPVAGIPLANRTLSQIFNDAFNAMVADSEVIALLNIIKEPPAGDNSLVTAAPATLEANGVSVSTITIEPLTATSERVGPGLVVDMNTTAGTITTPAIDNGDGLYTAFLTAPITVNNGSVTVVASIVSEDLTMQPVITLTADVTAPMAPDANRIIFVTVDSITTIIGLPGSAEPNSQLVIDNFTQGGSVTITVSADGSFRADITGTLGDQLTLRSTDATDNASTDTAMVVTAGLGLPGIANPEVLPGGTTPVFSLLSESAFGTIPAGFTFLRGFELDLQGNRASVPLDILIDAAVPVPPGKQLLLVEAITVQQAPALRVVGTGLAAGGILFTHNQNNVPGITTSGRYALLSAANAMAFSDGSVAGNRGAIENALMTLENSPFVDLTRLDGRYFLAGEVGTASVVTVQLFTHEAGIAQDIQLPFADAQVQRDFQLTTRANTVRGFTERFTPLGQTSRNLRLLPSGDQLYAALNVIGDLAIIDTATMNQVSVADDTLSIEDFAFTPNGFEAWIGYFSRVRDFTVNIEEPGLLVDNLGFPQAVAITPNSELALIASSLDNSSADTDPDAVFVIDAFSNVMEAASIPITADPSAIVVNRAGTRAYVISDSQGTIDIIDLPNRIVIDTATLGSRLDDIEVSPDGAELYVSEPNTNNVFVINAALAEDGIPGNELLATINVGAVPGALAITPDGNTLLVAEQQGDTVSVIDLTTRTVIEVLATVDVPFDIVVHPAGTTAYVLDPLSSQGILELPLAANDTTAPVLIDISPQDRSQSLLQDSPIEIVFSEKMDAATFNNLNIEILDADLTPIPGAFSGTGNDVATIFTPDAGVRYELNSQITVNVNTGLSDIAGNALAATAQRTVPVQTMQLPNLLNISIDLDTSGITAIGAAGAVEPDSEVLITNLTTSQVFRTDADASGTFTITLQGLDTDGYELLTQRFNGRAKTDPIPLPVSFSIVIPDANLISYTPGLAGTLQAIGAANAVDPQSSEIRINNLTSGQSFTTTTVNADGSFSLGIFANQGDSLALVSTILGTITLEPIPLSVPAFAPPVIDFITPDRFTFGDPVTLSIVGTDLGDVSANIKLEVGGDIRTDFTLDTRDENPAQQVMVVGLPAGANSGNTRVTFAGQSSNIIGYFAELAENTSPFGEEVISSNTVGDPDAALGQTDNVSVDLGEGGDIVIRLGSTVTDGAGNDLQIFEDTSDGEDCYEVQVSASSTGPFNTLGQFCGTKSVNLAGHSNIRFVKIIDAADGGNTVRIDAVFAVRVQFTSAILIDGEPITAGSGISADGGISVPLVSVSQPSGDAAMCVDDSKTFSVSVTPAPEGGSGYSPGCSDTCTWSATHGTINGSCSSASYQAPSSGVRDTIKVTVTRTGSCSTTGSDSRSVSIDVFEVESLLPDEGKEIPDGDGNPDTKLFVVGYQDSLLPNNVNVKAKSKPSMGLFTTIPSCWSLTGGNSPILGSGKLSRNVPKGTARRTVINAQAGTSKKQTTILILGYEVQHLGGSVCDGNSANISIKPKPSAEPISMLNHFSGLTLQSEPDHFLGGYGNVVGNTNLVFDPISSAFTSKIQNVIWFSTDLFNHNNQTSSYKLLGTASLDGKIVKAAESSLSKLTVDTDFGTCLNGSASSNNFFKGTPTLTTTPVAGGFTTIVGIGLFRRQPTTVISTAPTPVSSQYFTLVTAEENYHAGQHAGANGTVLAMLWDAPSVIANTNARGPFMATTLVGSQTAASTAFVAERNTEDSRSIILANSLRCAVEKEAKDAIGAVYRIQYKNAYPSCPSNP